MTDRAAPPPPQKQARKSAAQMAGESLARDEMLAPGSPRQFGVVMAVFFAILASIALWRAAWGWLALWTALTAAFGIAALAAPRSLEPLNRLWFRFGLLLHRIINPLVMGLMFFVVITPIGLLMRMLGKRPIPVSPDRAATTYWIARQTKLGPMSKQY